MKEVLVAVGALLGVLSACSAPDSGGYGAGLPTSDAVGASTTGGAQATTSGDGSSPFCQVQALLQTRCQSCHSDPPTLGVPMPLMTYDDLVAPMPGNGSTRVVDASLTRMQDTRLPMPPAPAAPATSAEVAVLQSWVDQGMPSSCVASTGGTSGGTTGSTTNEYDTPVTCTSNSNWTGGNEESPLMRPGGACISCHTSSREGPRFQLAGTVYPSAHEPDDCNGVNGGTSGAQVIVIDANGTSLTMNVNSAGNFYSQARTAIALPYTAKVVQNGLERVMATPQEDGDCNGCHTEGGANMAPGRIMLP